MPFVVKDRDTFKYPVKVKQPAENGAGLEVLTFTGEFKRFKQDKVRDIFNKMSQDRKLLDEVWTGWSGVKALVKRGDAMVEEELPVTPENRELLLVEPGVEAALVNAWLEATVWGPQKN